MTNETKSKLKVDVTLTVLFCSAVVFMNTHFVTKADYLQRRDEGLARLVRVENSTARLDREVATIKGKMGLREETEIRKDDVKRTSEKRTENRAVAAWRLLNERWN